MQGIGAALVGINRLWAGPEPYGREGKLAEWDGGVYPPI